jgi:hypothetical protein
MIVADSFLSIRVLPTLKFLLGHLQRLRGRCGLGFTLPTLSKQCGTAYTGCCPIVLDRRKRFEYIARP